MIYVDDREPKGIEDLILEQGVSAERRRLTVGDFQWWSGSGINLVSRKSSDLLPSVFSNHMQEELVACSHLIESTGEGTLVLLIEGVWSAEGDGRCGYYKKAGKWWRQERVHYCNPKTLTGLEISMHLSGIIVVHTTNHRSTAETLAQLYTRSQEGWPSEFLSGRRLPPLKHPGNPKVSQLMALVPRLSETVANRLLIEFGSIGEIVSLANEDPEQLRAVKGFGPTMMKRLKETLS